MDTIFDRLNAEFEQMGERLRQAFSESRLRAEKAGLVAQRGRAAYRLGLLVHARERGTEPELGAYERLMARMDDLTAKISEIDRRIAEDEGAEAAVHETPAPAAEEADAEVR